MVQSRNRGKSRQSPRFNSGHAHRGDSECFGTALTTGIKRGGNIHENQKFTFHKLPGCRRVDCFAFIWQTGKEIHRHVHKAKKVAPHTTQVMRNNQHINRVSGMGSTRHYGGTRYSGTRSYAARQYSGTRYYGGTGTLTRYYGNTGYYGGSPYYYGNGWGYGSSSVWPYVAASVAPYVASSLWAPGYNRYPYSYYGGYPYSGYNAYSVLHAHVRL